MTPTCAVAHHLFVVFPVDHSGARMHPVDQHTGPARGHRYTLDFPNATPTAPGDARELVRKYAPESVAYTAELAASELLTNVARHAPGAARLCMTVTAAVLVLSVTDQHPETPIRRPDPVDEPDPEAESGRGLRILVELGAQLAVRCDTGRKRVTARIPIGGDHA